MKIRTQNQLLEKIGLERVWRIREIAALRAECFGRHASEQTMRALRRSFVPIAYAHWEGFVKKTAHYYLEYVAMQNLRLGELNYPIVSIHLWKYCSHQLEKQKHFSLTDVCASVANDAGQRIRLHYEDVLPSTANLNSKTLRDVCDTLGVPFLRFETKAKFIDEALLGRRNHIAHGEVQDIDEVEVEELKTEVVSLIDAFRTEVENAAILEAFKRPEFRTSEVVGVAESG